MDSTRIDALRVSTAALRNDVEATRLRAGGSSGGSEQRVVDSVIKMQDLAHNVKAVLEVGDEVAVLVARMKVVERVHVAASSGGVRMAEVETSLTSLAASLAANASLLQTLNLVNTPTSLSFSPYLCISVSVSLTRCMFVALLCGYVLSFVTVWLFLFLLCCRVWWRI